MKSIIRFIYRARYGVRGAIKPPINHGCAFTLRYRWNYFWWAKEASIYNWTGLPDEWWNWARSQI